MARLKNFNGRYCESDYENAFLNFLERRGWQYLSGRGIPRASRREVLYTDDLEQFLSNTNPDLTPDEVRQIIGFAPSKDPKADELTNSNIKAPNNGETGVFPTAEAGSEGEAKELLDEVRPQASSENSQEAKSLLNQIRSKSEEVNRQNG